MLQDSPLYLQKKFKVYRVKATITSWDSGCRYCWFRFALYRNVASQIYIATSLYVHSVVAISRNVQSRNEQRQPPEVFCKENILKNFANFIGKHLCWILFLIKLQVFRPAKKVKSYTVFQLWFSTRVAGDRHDVFAWRIQRNNSWIVKKNLLGLT